MQQSAPNLLYLGVALFFVLLAGSVGLLQDDFNARLEGGRAKALYELVHGYIPNRPTDTPGAIAWLHWELKNYLNSRDAAGVVGELTQRDRRNMPVELEPMVQLLRQSHDKEVTRQGPISEPDWPEADGDEAYFRKQHYLLYEDSGFVMTRRKSLGQNPLDWDQASNRFLRDSLPRLHELKKPVLAEASGKRFHVARLYTLCEDGMLTTLPLANGEQPETFPNSVILQEGKVLRKMPKLPNFVSNEFFFIFDFESDLREQVFFSGLYLDLGGQGLVATLTTPIPGEGELRGVMGMDIAFELDWRDFAANVAAPLEVAVVSLTQEPRAEGWRPWRALLGASGQEPSRLNRALTELAKGEVHEGHFHNPSPIYHGIAGEEGALVAFRVDPDHWLVILFPESETRFPTLAIILASSLLLFLLIGFEWNRRRAMKAQAQTMAAFEEKQNLLETMQVPLMVVDPSTEEVVYSNRASLQLGIKPGGRFRDILADDGRAREHYDRMQTRGDTRRAYGLPLRVGDEERYAVIRSVSVRAPIHMIRADQRHRLGILFLIDPDRDLKLFSEVLVDEAQREERRKLSGLLSHGVDTLARVLNRRLERGQGGEFNTWLSNYVQRRIRVTAWVLERWGSEAPLSGESVIEAVTAMATLDRLNQVFEEVHHDPGLRAQLHWNNGVLAKEPKKANQPVFTINVQWPEQYCFSAPVHGGFGLFVGEVLINAVRHGAPGCTPNFQARLDPLRKWMTFTVTNEIDPDQEERARSAAVKAYGGRAILEELARLFRWQDLSFEVKENHFQVSWSVGVGEREDTCFGD